MKAGRGKGKGGKGGKKGKKGKKKKGTGQSSSMGSASRYSSIITGTMSWDSDPPSYDLSDLGIPSAHRYDSTACNYSYIDSWERK